MTLRFVIFFLVLLGLLTTLNVLVHRWASRDLRLSKNGRRVSKWLLIIGGAAFVASRAARFLPGLVLEVLGLVGATIELGVILVFVLFGLQKLAHRGARIASFLWRLARGKHPPSQVADSKNRPDVATTPVQPATEPAATMTLPVGTEPEPTGSYIGRRELLTQMAATTTLSLGGGASLYGAVLGRHDYVIEEVPVRLEALPRALDGFTLVQLSDVHLGTFVGEREIRSMLELVDRAGPDLLVLTGDLIDHDPSFADMLGSMVRRLSERAPVVAIAGNHDYYAGIGTTLGTLRRAGAVTLVNEARTVAEGAVVLAGVDDMWARRYGAGRGANVVEALARTPADRARVLLCHNPAYFAEAAEHVDLQLSGHTHGGQFNPGVRPADLVLPHGYVAGRYRRAGAELWVNRGFGTAGPPARLGAAPEVTKIVLTS